MQIDFKKQIPDGAMADTCTAAFNNLTADELEVAMANLALETLDELHYKPVPAEPLVLTQFNNDRRSKSWDMMAKLKRDEITTKIHSYPEVQEFMQKMSAATAKNLFSVKTLEDYISVWMEWDEPEKADRCHEIYKKFPDTMYIGRSAVWRKKTKDFAKR